MILFIVSSAILNEIDSADGVFYTGRVDHSLNEMNRLNGRMTPRKAAVICELDDECGGFTYHGPKTLWDGHMFQITFY